jgi:hypothetical protein
MIRRRISGSDDSGGGPLRPAVLFSAPQVLKESEGHHRQERMMMQRVP